MPTFCTRANIFLTLGAFVLLAPLAPVSAQTPVVNLNNAAVSVSSLTNLNYAQNFDSLITNGVANLSTLNTPALRGLQIARSGGTTPGNAEIIANNGAATGGSIYSYVISNGTDARFGTLTTTTSTGDLFYGFRFLNDTNSAISAITVSYTGEIWRSGQTNFAETLEFSSAVFDTGAGSILGTGYSIAGASLQYTKQSGGSVGTQQANLGTYRENKFGTITFAAPVTSGKEIWIRWADSDVAGTDHGLGINDVTVAFTALDPTPAPSALVSALIGSATLGLPLIRARWQSKRRLRVREKQA